MAQPIEVYRIAEMGHGTPLDVDGWDGRGSRGDHMLQVGITSTRYIARFWGPA